MTDRADSEDDEHPWVIDPRRMREELTADGHRLVDRLRRKLPASFQVQHGHAVRAALNTLIGGVDDPQLLASLPHTVAPTGGLTAPAPASGKRGSRSETDRLEASLANVQSERDALAETVALSKVTIAQLNQTIAGHAAVPKTPDVASLAKVTALRERVDGLVAQLADLQQKYDVVAGELDEYKALGTVGDFLAYGQLGSPQDIATRESRLRVLTRLALASVQTADSAAVQYEAVLGPLLLSLDRRGRLLESIFRSAVGLAPQSLPTSIIRPLDTVLPDIAETSDSAVSVSETLARLREDGRVRIGDDGVPTAEGLPMFAVPVLPSADELAKLGVGPSFGSSDLQQLVLGDRVSPDVRTAYDEMVALTREPWASERRSRSRTPRCEGRSAADGDDLHGDDDQHGDDNDHLSDRSYEYSTPPPSRSSREADANGGGVVDLVSPDRVQVTVPPAARPKSAAVVLVKAPRGTDSGRPESLTKASFVQLRVKCRSTFYEIVGRHNTRHKKPTWPRADPAPLLNPSSMQSLRTVPWLFDWFPLEQTTPQKVEYEQCVANGKSTRYVRLKEAKALYGRKPWQAIACPPSPVTFDPSDDRFLTFYQNACKLYSTGAQVLWERTHFILLEPPREHVRKADYNSSEFARWRWGDQRRRRYADFTNRWLGHLQLILHFFEQGLVDADFLLDPFLFWPPAFGVMLVVPEIDEELGRCIDRLDSSQPERVYFATPETTSQHIVYSRLRPGRAPGGRVHDRVVAKFVRSPSEVAEACDAPSDSTGDAYVDAPTVECGSIDSGSGQETDILESSDVGGAELGLDSDDDDHLTADEHRHSRTPDTRKDDHLTPDTRKDDHLTPDTRKDDHLTPVAFVDTQPGGGKRKAKTTRGQTAVDAEHGSPVRKRRLVTNVAAARTPSATRRARVVSSTPTVQKAPHPSEI